MLAEKMRSPHCRSQLARSELLLADEEGDGAGEIEDEHAARPEVEVGGRRVGRARIVRPQHVTLDDVKQGELLLVTLDRDAIAKLAMTPEIHSRTRHEVEWRVGAQEAPSSDEPVGCDHDLRRKGRFGATAPPFLGGPATDAQGSSIDVDTDRCRHEVSHGRLTFVSPRQRQRRHGVNTELHGELPGHTRL